MAGEMDLQVMLATLSPHRDAREYVFVTGPEHDMRSDAIMSFTEREGVTRIVPATDETADLRYVRIELQVHSSLTAVGLTAAVSDALTRVNISANIVAAFYHDHVFVPTARADDALQALLDLSRAAQA
ncbi:MAG: ACT domain-containing protein [Pseudomonadota bacterium]